MYKRSSPKRTASASVQAFTMRESARTTSLPPDLQRILDLELDPGESLRWAGQPMSKHVWRRSLRGSLFIAAVCLSLFALILWAGWQTFRDLRGSSSPGLFSVTFAFPFLCALAMSVFMSYCTFEALRFPWKRAAHARRTIYAVTNTRVFVLRMSHKGLVAAEAIEPSHPLSLSRQEFAADCGDLYVFPTFNQQNHRVARALLTFEAVPNPRHIERLIRQTFDPPAPPPHAP